MADVSGGIEPAILSVSPSYNTKGVSVTSDLYLNFNEPVKASGSVSSHFSLIGSPNKYTGTSNTEIYLYDSTQVSISGSQVRINPTADLEPGKQYSLYLTPGSLQDQAGHQFLGGQQYSPLISFTTAGNTIANIPVTNENSDVYRLYQAAFARMPDEGGVSHWIGKHNTGMSLPSIASYFINSNEFKQTYGTNLTNAQFVELLYKNVLGRQPDVGGSTFWTEALNKGVYTKEDAVVRFAESPENVSKTAPYVDHGYWVQ